MKRLAVLALLLPPLLVFVVFFICPLVYLFHVSLHEASQSELYGATISLATYRAIFDDPFYATIILRTLKTAAIILAFALFIGYVPPVPIPPLAPPSPTISPLPLLFPPPPT